mmetsp:Transcript_81133/g.173574  ORF Transcript_81133/g.173574 Transcript_81133/m.173574 type:complete len:281 (-) Transcript_81133:494-1336(-)
MNFFSSLSDIIPSPFKSAWLNVCSNCLSLVGDIFSEIMRMTNFLKCVSEWMVIKFVNTSFSNGLSESSALCASLSQAYCKSFSTVGLFLGSLSSIAFKISRAGVLTLGNLLSTSGSLETMFSASSTRFFPGNGHFPYMSWKRITPTDHTSQAGVLVARRSETGKSTSCFPVLSTFTCFSNQGLTTSGAENANVSFCNLCTGSGFTRSMRPRSVTTRPPEELISTFFGAKEPWMMGGSYDKPALIARTSCQAISADLRSLMCLDSTMLLWSVPPGIFAYIK